MESFAVQPYREQSEYVNMISMVVGWGYNTVLKTNSDIVRQSQTG